MTKDSTVRKFRITADDGVIICGTDGLNKNSVCSVLEQVGIKYGDYMKTKEIKIGEKKAIGIEIPLNNAVLVFARAEKGFVMCGYLNMDTAEKLGDAACMVRGVKTVEDLLNAKIVAVTSKARQYGIETGITGRQALEKLV